MWPCGIVRGSMRVTLTSARTLGEIAWYISWPQAARHRDDACGNVERL